MQEGVLRRNVSSTKDNEVGIAYQLCSLGCCAPVKQGVALKNKVYILKSLPHTCGTMLAELDVVGMCGYEDATYRMQEFVSQFVEEAVCGVNGTVHSHAWAAR